MNEPVNTLSDNGRWYCPYCTFSTQLVNKAQRHLTKKHGDVVSALAEVETAVNDVPDDEEE